MFCVHIPWSIVARGAYLLCSDGGLNWATFSTTAVHLRHSAQWKEDFAVMLSCRDYESFPWAFHTLPRIYFMYKFDFLFWRWCLLDHLVQMYAWCLNLSFLDLADDCRNSVGPGVRLGPWSFILIRLAGVFMLLHKCEFIRIEYVKFCVGIKFSKALSLKKLLFIFNWNFFGGNCRFTCSCTKAASEMAGKQRFWFRGG